MVTTSELVRQNPQTASEPRAKARPEVKIIFDLGALAGQDFGHLFNSFEFKGMVNGGYIVRAKLFDPHFNLLSKLVEEGYFRETRTRPVFVQFQIKAGSDGKFPNSATRVQTAIMLELKADGGAPDEGLLEFIAMDAPSWYLNMGDASGRVWKGRVDQVISQVVEQYAPGVTAEVGRTTDSPQGRWYMMRQDPKTFISSLLDWSSSITQKKTHWLVASDGLDLIIKEQGQIASKQRAFYRFMENQDHDTVLHWEFLSDNALSVVQSKLVTQGLSTVSGQYFDKITDEAERIVFAKDTNTTNKQIARVKEDRTFTKPPDAGPPRVGWSSISAIPEYHSSGDIGLRYDEYVDGRARGLWLNMMNALVRVKLECLGHGEWSDCRGLGVDTAFVRWTSDPGSDGADKYWWMTGNWIVYGFHHRVSRGKWYTDVYCARFDHDAVSKRVGGGGGVS